MKKQKVTPEQKATIEQVTRISRISKALAVIVGDELAKKYFLNMLTLTAFIPAGKKSGNQKTGDIGQFYGSHNSCPATSCIFKKIGCCYAMQGHCAHWFDVATGKAVKVPKKDEYKSYSIPVTSIPDIVAGKGDGQGRLYRVNVSGDICYTGTNDINTEYLSVIAGSFLGANYKPYTYTHCEKSERNFAILKAINGEGMTVNVSCDTVADVEKAVKAGLPAVITVESMPEDSVKRNGVTYVKCLAQSRGMECKDCTACSRCGRKCAIVFELHGPAGIVNRAKKSGALVKSL